MNLPGYAWTKDNRWDLYAFGGDHSWASYMDENGIILTIRKNNEDKLIAKIENVWKLITFSSNEFSFPGNFEIFYKQMKTVSYAISHL